MLCGQANAADAYGVSSPAAILPKCLVSARMIGDMALCTDGFRAGLGRDGLERLRDEGGRKVGDEWKILTDKVTAPQYSAPTQSDRQSPQSHLLQPS
jgi:hypothetical protein